MSRVLLMGFAAALAAGQVARASGTVAIINETSPTPYLGEIWCAFLQDNGYECIVFASTGPEGPIADFDVVIDMSQEWADPTGMLADHMRAHKGVIIWGGAPWALGVGTDPTVQAWIGANAASTGFDLMFTTDVDPILGDLPPGSVLKDCQDSGCWAVADTTGHPNAKVLARWNRGGGPIGLMRNTWEGGESVYFTDSFHLGYPFDAEILLNTMEMLTRPVPAVSQWELVIMALVVVSAGSVVITRRNVQRIS